MPLAQERWESGDRCGSNPERLRERPDRIIHLGRLLVARTVPEGGHVLDADAVIDGSALAVIVAEDEAEHRHLERTPRGELQRPVTLLSRTARSHTQKERTYRQQRHHRGSGPEEHRLSVQTHRRLI